MGLMSVSKSLPRYTSSNENQIAAALIRLQVISSPDEIQIPGKSGIIE